MQRYEARIWEKAEHWYFYVTIEAASVALARTALIKDYPKRSYTIQYIR